MDCTKVGKLILKLRKDKHMTQKQLAEMMNISDKTISKWERGLGCPDVTLLHDLSNILGVNVEKILIGDLEQNAVDGGNMKKVKFYVCPECGNLLTATGNPEISCCGKKLKPLVPHVSDDAHKLEIQTIEDDYYITWTHDMTKEHYINFVAYVRFDRVLMVRLYPEQNPEVRFPRHYGGKIYYGCNKHGLWVNP